jgi:hypothetical protein
VNRTDPGNTGITCQFSAAPRTPACSRRRAGSEVLQLPRRVEFAMQLRLMLRVGHRLSKLSIVFEM